MSTDGVVIVAVQAIFGLYNDDQSPDVITRLGYLDAQIKPLHEVYDKLGAAIYSTLSTSGVFQAAIFSAIMGFGQEIRASRRCEDWSPFILLGLASALTILVVLYKFLEQFDLCKLGKQLLQQRDFLLEGYLQNDSLTIYRGTSLFPEADQTQFRWWSLRVAFLVTLIGIASYVFLACISLLCL